MIVLERVGRHLGQIRCAFHGHGGSEKGWLVCTDANGKTKTWRCNHCGATFHVKEL